MTGQVILGGNDFVSRIEELLDEKKEIKEIPKSQRYLGRPLLSELFMRQTGKDKNIRNRVIQTAHFSYSYTLKEVGECLGIHYSTVSRVLAANKNKM